jgi:aspartokinase
LWFTPAIDRNYPGRWTAIVLLLENQSMSKAAAALKAAGISAASVKSREMPLRSEEARNALHMKEGDQYRIYLSQSGKTRWLVAGKALRD